MRSSSGTYNWLAADREGTSKAKPLPERMERAILRIRDSIVDCTDERERSVTSRQEEERPRSSRVLDEEEDEAVEQSLNSWRI